MEGFRNERCLLTMARSRGVLQDTLGRDLRVMTTEERLAEFKKRGKTILCFSFVRL